MQSLTSAFIVRSAFTCRRESGTSISIASLRNSLANVQLNGFTSLLNGRHAATRKMLNTQARLRMPYEWTPCTDKNNANLMQQPAQHHYIQAKCCSWVLHGVRSIAWHLYIQCRSCRCTVSIHSIGIPTTDLCGLCKNSSYYKPTGCIVLKVIGLCKNYNYCKPTGCSEIGRKKIFRTNKA